MGFTYNTIGEVHLQRGRLEQARESLQQAVEIHTVARGAADRRSVFARRDLIEALRWLGLCEEALPLIATQIELLEVRDGPAAASLVEPLRQDSACLRAAGRDAEADAREARANAIETKDSR